MGSLPPIRIVIEQAESKAIDHVFTRSFRIGRDVECDVTIQDSHVSRNHVEVEFQDQCWWVTDLNSTNGLYLNGEKVDHAPVADADVLNLGKDGPGIVFSYLTPEAAAAFARNRFDRIKGRRSVGSFRTGTLVLAAVLLLVGFGFFFGRRQLDRHDVIREKAAMLFAEIRATEVDIASVYAQKQEMDRLRFAQRLNELGLEREAKLEEYKGTLIQLGLYQTMDGQESLIYNVARFFNESELGMPTEFMDEVKSEIYDYWLDEGEESMKEALTRAQIFDYTQHVVKSLKDYGLPVEFFYLPVVVSGFDSETERALPDGSAMVGVWQLSQASAEAYGLTGLSSSNELSILPVDGRHEFHKSTEAAVRLLQDIYRQEAMASGLLTLAVYLQHEQNAAAAGSIELSSVLAQVPAAVESRNLWTIRQNYPQLISDQVYQQVVRIFAAAVIGQEPQVFGLEVLTPTAVNTFKSFR